MSETSDNIVRGKFRHYKAPPLPERRALKEAAHAEQINQRLAMIMVDGERELGLGRLRDMIIALLGKIDERVVFKGKRKS